MVWKKRYHKPGDPIEGYYFDIGTFVCKSHFNDYFLNNHIKLNGKKGTCSYCKKYKIVLELEFVLELISVGMDYIYEDPLNSRYYNKESTYGLDGNVMNFLELWWDDPFDLRIENLQLAEDICNKLNDEQLFCERNEFGSHEDYLHDLWSHFKKVLKHKARFTFHLPHTFREWDLLDPVDILLQVQITILRNNMISELPENTKLYRTRQHKSIDDVIQASDISSLPNHLNKKAGRMNAAGISLFYCSKDKGLTIREVVNKKQKSCPFYTTSIFRNKEVLKLVDFTKLPEVPSIFDSKNNRYRDIIFFMRTFMEEISLPILRKNTILEYLPTQVITEYLRYNPELNVQGMIYWSSKNPNKKNIVLFYDSDDSLEKLNFSKSSIATNLVSEL